MLAFVIAGEWLQRIHPKSVVLVVNNCNYPQSAVWVWLLLGEGLGSVTVVLVELGGEAVCLDVAGDAGGPGLLACVVVGVGFHEVVILVAEDLLGRGVKACTVGHLFEGGNLPLAVLALAQVHQSRMASARDILERVAVDVVVENPEVTPHADVGLVGVVGGGNDGAWDAHVAPGVALGERVGEKSVDGCDARVHAVDGRGVAVVLPVAVLSGRARCGCDCREDRSGEE